MHCLEPGCNGRLRVCCTHESDAGRVRRSRRCDCCGVSLSTDEKPVPRNSKAVDDGIRTAVLIALARGIKPSVIVSRYQVSELFVSTMRLTLTEAIKEDTRLSDDELTAANSAPTPSLG